MSCTVDFISAVVFYFLFLSLLGKFKMVILILWVLGSRVAVKLISERKERCVVSLVLSHLMELSTIIGGHCTSVWSVLLCFELKMVLCWYVFMGLRVSFWGRCFPCYAFMNEHWGPESMRECVCLLGVGYCGGVWNQDEQKLKTQSI